MAPSPSPPRRVGEALSGTLGAPARRARPRSRAAPPHETPPDASPRDLAPCLPAPPHSCVPPPPPFADARAYPLPHSTLSRPDDRGPLRRPRRFPVRRAHDRERGPRGMALPRVRRGAPRGGGRPARARHRRADLPPHPGRPGRGPPPRPHAVQQVLHPGRPRRARRTLGSRRPLDDDRTPPRPIAAPRRVPARRVGPPRRRRSLPRASHAGHILAPRRRRPRRPFRRARPVHAPRGREAPPPGASLPRRDARRGGSRRGGLLRRGHPGRVVLRRRREGEDDVRGTRQAGALVSLPGRRPRG